MWYSDGPLSDSKHVLWMGTIMKGEVKTWRVPKQLCQSECVEASVSKQRTAAEGTAYPERSRNAPSGQPAGLSGAESKGRRVYSRRPRINLRRLPAPPSASVPAVGFRKPQVGPRCPLPPCASG